MTFGGRAAEQIVFNKISTGAQSDLDQVTKMAYSMISVFGMNEQVGQVSFYGLSNDSFQKPYSDDTATLIDSEVRKLLDHEYQRAQELLREHREELETLAHTLLDKEVLHKSDIERLIGPRPFKSHDEALHFPTQHEDADIEQEPDGSRNDVRDMPEEQHQEETGG
jgi:cell division protease FtsH